MDDLRRAMLDAAAPRDEWQAELPFLIESGQKRVRRRRMIATGIAAAAVAVIGTTAALAGVPGLNKSEPDPVQERHSGVYVEEKISPAEVERRCNLVRLQDLPRSDKSGWVAGIGADGRAVPAAESSRPVETRVGLLVALAPLGADRKGGSAIPSGGGPVELFKCTIPQESMLDLEPWTAVSGIPDLADETAIIEACSRGTRYRFEGWDVLTGKEHPASFTDHGRVTAILMSRNGFSAVCDVGPGLVAASINPKSWRDKNGAPEFPGDDSGPADPDRYQELAPVCAMDGIGTAGCGIVAVIVGLPDGYRVETTLPDGSRVGATTHHGAVVYGFQPREKGLDSWRFPTRVLDPSGELLWSGEPGSASP